MFERVPSAVAVLALLTGSWLLAAGKVAAGPLLLFEAGSGKVLYAEDQDDKWYPASLTKIMTAYITFQELKAGRLNLADKVSVSELAHKEPPSKLGLPVGGEITVDLALRVLIVKSANDVAVMLAEKISGSVEGFAQRMNATAKRLGMTGTHFVNPNGLPNPGQVTTARDLAILTRAVLKDFPEHQNLWAMKEIHVGKMRLRSHNGLLKNYDGADGIKTGFICDAGFNIVASATRDGRRLVAVVLGEPSGKERTVTAASLLEHGFGISQWKMFFGVPTLDNLPRDAAAKPVASVRQSVTAWNCNGRKPARRSVKRKAVRAKSASKSKPKAATSKAASKWKVNTKRARSRARKAPELPATSPRRASASAEK